MSAYVISEADVRDAAGFAAYHRIIAAKSIVWRPLPRSRRRGKRGPPPGIDPDADRSARNRLMCGSPYRSKKGRHVRRPFCFVLDHQRR